MSCDAGGESSALENHRRNDIIVVHACLKHHNIPVDLRTFVVNYLFAIPTDYNITDTCASSLNVDPPQLNASPLDDMTTRRELSYFDNDIDISQCNIDFSTLNVSPISVSDVTNVTGMFQYPPSYCNQALDTWDVLPCSQQQYMFYDVYSFTRELPQEPQRMKRKTEQITKFQHDTTSQCPFSLSCMTFDEYDSKPYVNRLKRHREDFDV